MEKNFRDYKHYTDWINFFFENSSKKLDDAIISQKLLIEKECTSSGEPYRSLSKSEFLKRVKSKTISIPTSSTTSQM